MVESIDSPHGDQVERAAEVTATTNTTVMSEPTGGAYTTAMVWSGPLAVAGVLAVVAGIAKWTRPEPAVAAMRSMGLRLVGPALVRAGAALEVAIGAGALTGWKPAMLALGLSYVAFAVFVVAARANPSVRSCGCLGEGDAPPSWRHVVVDAGLAAGCVGAFVAGVPDLGSVLAKQPLAGVPFSAVVVTSVWLTSIVLADRSAALARAARSVS